MTLTEQWKKGELEAGWYYVLLFSNEEYITFIDGNWVVDDRLIGDDIKEVLTLVPSYDDFKRIIDDWRDVSYENKNLKKLLKECRDDVYKYQYISFGTLVKIDNAIGEK